MEIKQLWCVGFKKNEQAGLKLSFRVYDAVLDGDTYTIDFTIPVEKECFKITRHPDILILEKVEGIEFRMIAQTSGIHIVKRLDNDKNFINTITPIIKQYLLNNEIHINFELNKEAYEILIAS